MTHIITRLALTAGCHGRQLALTARPHPQPIGDLAATSPGIAVTATGLGNAIILAPVAGTSLVRVIADGQFREVHADLDAVPITDPATGLAVTRQGLAWALAAHHTAGDRIRDLYAQLDRDRLAHHQKLDQIRSYAIARHRDGDICRDGLNDFLRHFNLPVYQPRHRVRFTITGSFDVRADAGRSIRDTEYDVREYLRLDTDQVDDVDTDTLSVDVTVDAVEADE